MIMGDTDRTGTPRRDHYAEYRIGALPSSSETFDGAGGA